MAVLGSGSGYGLDGWMGLTAKRYTQSVGDFFSLMDDLIFGYPGWIDEALPIDGCNGYHTRGGS